MKHILIPCSLSLCIALTTFTGCKKDILDPDGDTPASTDPLKTLGMPSDADGALIAICTITKQSVPGMPGGGVEVETGTAVAVFGDLAGGNFSDAGNVSVAAGQSGSSFSLEKQDNNAYVSKPSASNPQGPGFKTANTGTIPFWKVPTRNISDEAGTAGFPETPVISSSTTIKRSSGYTFALSADPQADKILYVIASGNKYVTKTMVADPNTDYRSAVFSASELADLPASDQALMQAVPYNEIKKVIDSKNYYFINEVVLSQTVTVE